MLSYRKLALRNAVNYYKSTCCSLVVYMMWAITGYGPNSLRKKPPGRKTSGTKFSQEKTRVSVRLSFS